MKKWLAVFALIGCLALATLGRPSARVSASITTEDHIRALEQTWLDAESVPDLPVLQKMFSDNFMGSSFGKGVLGKSDVVPSQGASANHLPKSTLKNSTVRIFGDTAVLMGEVEMQVPEKPESIQMTTVFQKHGEDWQVIAVHMSKPAL